MKPIPETLPFLKSLPQPFPHHRHRNRPLRHAVRRSLVAAGAGLVVLGSAVAVSSTAAADQPTIDGPTGTFYVTDYGGKILSIPVTDGDFGTPETLASGLPDLKSVTVSGDTVFALGLNGSVWSIPAAGGPPHQVSHAAVYPEDIAVSGDTLYVTGSGDSGGMVLAIPAGGGDPEVLAQVEGTPWGITTSGQTVYVAVLGEEGIFSVPMSGGSLERVADAPMAHSLTTDGSNLFYGDNYAGTLSSVPITGGESTKLGDVKMRDLVAVGEDIYATVLNGGVAAIPKTGGDATTVVEGLMSPEGIAFAPAEEPCPGPSGSLGSLEDMLGSLEGSVAGSVAGSAGGAGSWCGGGDGAGSMAGSIAGGGAGSHAGS